MKVKRKETAKQFQTLGADGVETGGPRPGIQSPEAEPRPSPAAEQRPAAAPLQDVGRGTPQAAAR